MSYINLNQVKNLSYLKWEKLDSGTSDGILNKNKAGNTYLKLASYNKYYGFYGREPLLELINSRIGQILNLPVLDYGLWVADVILDNTKYRTLVSTSKNYALNKKVVSFERFFTNNRQNNEMPLEFVKRYNWKQFIYKQFIFDFIICNMDRHGKNNDILIDDKKRLSVAPFFDNSLTFVTNRPDNDINQKVTYNDSLRTNNFIGSPYLIENIYNIDETITLRSPKKDDRKELFQGLGKVTTREFRDYVWWLLQERVKDVRKSGIRFIQWY